LGELVADGSNLESHTGPSGVSVRFALVRSVVARTSFFAGPSLHKATLNRRHFIPDEGNQTMTNKKPVHEIRLGRVRAAIWENETSNGTRHNATFSRLYRDEQGTWHDSNSFGRDDLPLLWKVADGVHTWILQQPYTSAEKTESNRTVQSTATVETPF
jgi:hypothetical protein